MLVTVPNTARVNHILYQPKFSSVCSIGKAPFYGFIEIDYAPVDVLLEFMSFEQWLKDVVAATATTVEEINRLVVTELRAVLGSDVELRVTVHAETTVHGPVESTIFDEGED